MKRLMLSVIILLAALVLYGAAGEKLFSKGTPSWFGYNEGMLKARQSGKPVLVDFYASWCHWCKVMDRETFSDDKVIRKLRSDYISIRLDMESDEAIRMGGRRFSPKDYASMLGVEGLPTVAFFDKGGKLITMVPGYVKAGTMLPLLNYIGDECYMNQVSFRDYIEKKKACGKK